MKKEDVEMKEASQKNGAESEEPVAEVSKEEKERLALEGRVEFLWLVVKISDLLVIAVPILKEMIMNLRALIIYYTIETSIRFPCNTIHLLCIYMLRLYSDILDYL